MTDRVYPSSKPANPPPPSSFSAPKPYNPPRPMYRPQPKTRPRRNWCCLCCLWTTIFVLCIIFLAAIAGCVLWVLYRPQRPNFSVNSLRLEKFKLTSSRLTTHLDLNVTARNPNKKLVYLYDPITVSVLSDGVDIGDGSFPAFVHGTKNTTNLRASISGGNADLDSDSEDKLKAGLKKKNGLPLEIRLETKVSVKMDGLKTKKVRIRVNCDGINAVVPKGKVTRVVDGKNAECKVKLRVKIWKWSI